MAEATSPDSAKKTLASRVRNLAYLHQPEEPFTLASGRKSAHFFDMKPVMCDPECAHLLGVLIHDKINEIGLIDAIGGLELGAVPLTGIAIAKAPPRSELRGFIIRKEPKGRGGRKTGNPPGIEGSTLVSGDRCLILEDVTTTGGSALQACKRLEDIGCEIIGCITILDREEGGSEAFADAEVPLHPLLTLSDIVNG